MDDCLGYIIGGGLVLYLVGLFITYVVIPIISAVAVVMAVGGLAVGLFFSLYNYITALSEVFAKKRVVNVNKNKEPAFVSYFFGRSYVDMGEVVRTTWDNNFDKIRATAKKLGDSFAQNGVIIGLITMIMYGLTIIILLTVGVAISVALSVVHIAVLVVFNVIVYLIALLVWGIDKIYLSIHKMFGACPYCKRKYSIPTYVCDCGAKHRNLVPGKYGIFRRKCMCGRKIPTTILFGRRKLNAECPECGRSLNNDAGVSEAVPVCIPVIGGPSVGKTCYITAVMKELLEKVSPKTGINIAFYNNSNKVACENMINLYNQGAIQSKTSDYNPAAYNFFVHTRQKPERLLYFYDIAGEAFNDVGGLSTQAQYEYAHGFIFIIDPFSIPRIASQYSAEGNLSAYAISDADTNDTFATFMSNLGSLSGLSPSQLSKIPCAIVINKVDAVGLDREFGRGAINRLLNTDEYAKWDFGDLMDYKIRDYLKQNGMSNFVNNIEISFKKNRFFAVSALGHVQNGQGFKGILVLEPFEWIVSETDSGMRDMFKLYRNK